MVLPFTLRKDFLLPQTYLQILTQVFHWIYFTQYLAFFSSIDHLSLCTVLDFISTNIYQALLINTSANVFVFEDFNVHHKFWLTYSSGTDRPGEGELCYSFSIINGLIQMVNFPTQIPNCDCQSPAFLDLFFLLMVVFVLQCLTICQGNVKMFLFQIPLAFHQTQNGIPHFIAQLMIIHVLIGTVFVIIWQRFHFRISLNSVLLLLPVNFVCRLRLELIHMYIYMYMYPSS